MYHILYLILAKKGLTTDEYVPGVFFLFLRYSTNNSDINVEDFNFRFV